MAWLVLGLTALVCSVELEASPTLIARADTPFVIWLANASPVNFGDLQEVITLKPPHERSLKMLMLQWLHGADVYEGFFEPYHEGVLILPKAAQNVRSCLTPEAEWVVVFVNPAKAQDKMRAGQWGQVIVELRGMMEGKNLEFLDAAECPPAWKAASAGNNVVATSGLGPFRLGELECRLVCEGTSCEYDSGSCSSLSATIEVAVGDRTVFSSNTMDLRSLLMRIPSDQPLRMIVQKVFGAFEGTHGTGSSTLLKAVNLSAAGDQAAIVNNPQRRMEAEQCLGVSRYIKALWDPCIKARVMKQLARNVLTAKSDGICLGAKDFILRLNGSEELAVLGRTP